MRLGKGRTVRWIAGVAALVLLGIIGFALSRFVGEVEVRRADSPPGQQPGASFSITEAPGAAEKRAAKNAVAEDTPAGRLVLAARSGDAAQVREILAQGVPPDAEEAKNGHRALHQAASSGHLEVVDLLLAAGAAADVPDGQGQTPLMRAAGAAAVPTGRRLLDAGADVNARSVPDGETALTRLVTGTVQRRFLPDSGEAATGDPAAELEFARMLFDGGADPNLQPERGSSPLKMLVVSQNAELLTLFVEHGARADGDADLAMFGMMPGPIGDALRAARSGAPDSGPPAGSVSR